MKSPLKRPILATAAALAAAALSVAGLATAAPGVPGAAGAPGAPGAPGAHGAPSNTGAPGAFAGPGSSAAQNAFEGSSRAAADAQRGIEAGIADGWRQAYDALPPNAQGAVPKQLQPALPSLPPASHRPATNEPGNTRNASNPGGHAGSAQGAGKPGQPGNPGGQGKPANCANCVAITYDDGPVADTNRLLDTLRQRNVHATFFVTGRNAGANGGVVKRMRAEGHTVGNHTNSHPQLPGLSDGAIGAELDATNNAIRGAAGVQPRWLRPPYGATDGRVAGVARQRGLALALWDVDTRDWAHRNAQTTCSVAVDSASAGSIILMHDIHRSTVDAASCVIDGLRAKGLRPVSLDEMIPQPAPGMTYERR